jgi:hypothetical protein
MLLSDYVVEMVLEKGHRNPYILYKSQYVHYMWKLSLQQAIEAHRIVRRRGSHIF